MGRKGGTSMLKPLVDSIMGVEDDQSGPSPHASQPPPLSRSGPAGENSYVFENKQPTSLLAPLVNAFANGFQSQESACEEEMPRPREEARQPSSSTGENSYVFPQHQNKPPKSLLAPLVDAIANGFRPRESAPCRFEEEKASAPVMYPPITTTFVEDGMDAWAEATIVDASQRRAKVHTKIASA